MMDRILSAFRGEVLVRGKEAFTPRGRVRGWFFPAQGETKMTNMSKKGFSFLAIFAAALLWGNFGVSDVEGAPVNLVIAVGGKGTGTGRIGGSLYGLVNKSSKKVRLTTRTSGGIVAITRVVESGRAHLGLSSSVLLDLAQRKSGPFRKAAQGARNLQGVGPVTTSWFHLVTFTKSGIKTYKDLVGKRLSVGRKGSNTNRMTTFITERLGITGKIRMDFLNNKDAVSSMADEKIDAFTLPNPVPSPAVLRAARLGQIRLIDMPENIRDAFLKNSPGYFKDNKDASSYPGMKGKSFKTVAYSLFVIANKKAPNDAVYEMMRVVYDPKNGKYLVSAYKAWKVGLESAKSDGFLKHMKSFNIRVHPGAARYWKERGYAVN